MFFLVDRKLESIVIRILDDRKVITDLEKLGLQKKAKEDFVTAVSKPQGIVILTGPTGSGKSTTLIAALHHVISPTLCILTVEDPVEIQVEGGWLLKDEDDTNAFMIPDSTTLASGEYLVLCKDTLKFKANFPGVRSYVGNFDFGFSADGELIRLMNAQGHMIDAVTYDDASPWPTEPDGHGPTLELRNPNFDNAIAGNWSSSDNHGTPGALNSSFSLLATRTPDAYPAGFALAQNYPNPFNAATIISYTVPAETRVILSVYDVLGREIATLIDAVHQPGEYEQLFLAGQLTSGIYFYVISAQDFREVRKMILLK